MLYHAELGNNFKTIYKSATNWRKRRNQKNYDLIAAVGLTAEELEEESLTLAITKEDCANPPTR